MRTSHPPLFCPLDRTTMTYRRRPFNNWEGVRKSSWPMTAIGLAVGALSLLLQSAATLLLLAAATAASGILSRPDLLFAMFEAVGVVSRFVLPVVIPGALFLIAIIVSRLADRLATVSGPPLLALWTRTGLAVFVGAALAASVLPTYVALADGTSASKFLEALAWSLLPLVPSALVAGFIGIPITGLLRWRRGYPCRRDYLPLSRRPSACPRLRIRSRPDTPSAGAALLSAGRGATFWSPSQTWPQRRSGPLLARLQEHHRRRVHESGGLLDHPQQERQLTQADAALLKIAPRTGVTRHFHQRRRAAGPGVTAGKSAERTASRPATSATTPGGPAVSPESAGFARGSRHSAIFHRLDTLPAVSLLVNDRWVERRVRPAVVGHWMISVACCSTDCGMLSPRSRAVLRLMTKSNLVGCSIGRSAGLAPLRILSTKVAARRCWSAWSGP